MRIIDTSRYIRSSPISRLDQVALSSGGTSHTHPNKPFLDELNIDLEDRLLYADDLVEIPLLQEDW